MVKSRITGREVKEVDTTDYPRSLKWSPERFPYHLSAARLCVNIIDVVSYDKAERNRAFLNPRYNLLGYCDGGKLPFRPKPGTMALMLWDKQEEDQFWCHITKKDWDDGVCRILAGPGR